MIYYHFSRLLSFYIHAIEIDFLSIFSELFSKARGLFLEILFDRSPVLLILEILTFFWNHIVLYLSDQNRFLVDFLSIFFPEAQGHFSDFLLTGPLEGSYWKYYHFFRLICFYICSVEIDSWLISGRRFFPEAEGYFSGNFSTGP